MSQTANVEAARFPRGVLMGAGALMAFAFVATLYGRAAGVGDVHMPATAAYETLQLDFVDANDGGVLVRDATSGALLYRAAPGTNGFLRSAVRGFAQERLRDGAGRAAPFTLTRWDNGTLSFQDRETGRRIDLDAFGPTQAEAFAQIFAAKGGVR